MILFMLDAENYRLDTEYENHLICKVALVMMRNINILIIYIFIFFNIHSGILLTVKNLNFKVCCKRVTRLLQSFFFNVSVIIHKTRKPLVLYRVNRCGSDTLFNRKIIDPFLLIGKAIILGKHITQVL